MKFDLDAARKNAEGNPAALMFLEANKDRLVALTEQAIMAIVAAYLAGNDQNAVTAFYGLDGEAAEMIVGSGDIADRRYQFKQRALSVTKIVVQLIISALAAGVIL
jgi:hypothetical protein